MASFIVIVFCISILDNPDISYKNSNWVYLMTL